MWSTTTHSLTRAYAPGHLSLFTSPQINEKTNIRPLPPTLVSMLKHYSVSANPDLYTTFMEPAGAEWSFDALARVPSPLTLVQQKHFKEHSRLLNTP